MHVNMTKELAALRKLTMRELRSRYAEAFGEQTNANNKAWLLKRIAWRLQANAEGDLSERARRRAEELANDADLRLSPPKPKEAQPGEHTRVASIPAAAESRLPPPGTVITREYKGETLQVMVLTDGVEYEGERYKSLSAVANAITGQHVNGRAFFGLTKEVA
jgi:Protein of unknown function (DUF2924)